MLLTINVAFASRAANSSPLASDKKSFPKASLSIHLASGPKTF
jgi:hypothetical protein